MTDKVVITTIKAGETEEREDTLVQQMTYSLELNGTTVISSICSPGDLRSLAAGYLVTHGYLNLGEAPISLDQDGNSVSIKLTGIPEILEPPCVESNYTVTPETILSRVTESAERGEVFRKTGGTHSACVCMENSIECFVEDISRSAALEKSIGCASLMKLNLDRSFIVLSSRIPVDFVRKTARAGIPIIAAVSAPTMQAVDEAEKLGICLCCFVRGDRMNVYSNKWRLGL